MNGVGKAETFRANIKRKFNFNRLDTEPKGKDSQNAQSQGANGNRISTRFEPAAKPDFDRPEIRAQP
jgi:hypothetical protein